MTAGITTHGLDAIAVTMTATHRSNSWSNRDLSWQVHGVINVMNAVLPVSIRKRYMGEDRPGKQHLWRSDSKFDLQYNGTVPGAQWWEYIIGYVIPTSWIIVKELNKRSEHNRKHPVMQNIWCTEADEVE